MDKFPVPKVTWTATCTDAAKQTREVLFSFAVNGEAVESFPHKRYAIGGICPPEMAAEAIKFFNDWLDRLNYGLGEPHCPVCKTPRPPKEIP